MFVLSELRPPNSIELSVTARVLSPTQSCVVVARVNCLQFFSVVDPDRPALHLVESLQVDDKIVALHSFCHPSLANECLVVLTESSSLLFLVYDGAKFEVIFNVILDSSHQSPPSDSPPRIVMDPAPEPRYFLVYCFENFVQLATINANWSAQATTKRQRKPDLVSCVSFSIGNVVLQDVQALVSARSLVALFYRDYNYNYSLRYYEVDPDNRTFTLVSQFEEFDDVPNAMVAPAFGGCVILANGFVFYFPDPQVRTLDVADHADLSVNRTNRVVTKTLRSTPSDLAVFHRSVVIDAKRVLVVNNKGHSSILYLNTSSTSDYSLVFEDLTLVSIGYTTIPASVHHITGNLFFISSKLSQSVLFNILPQEPYINIRQFLASSPPVLDIQSSFTSNSLQLLTCQGGYESGEFRRVSARTSYLSFVSRVQSGLDCASVKCVGDGVMVANTANDQAKFFRLENEVLKEYHSSPAPLDQFDGERTVEVFEDRVVSSSSLYSGTIIAAKVASDKFFVAVGEDNTLLVFFKELQHQHPLLSKSEVSSIDYTYYYAQQYLVLVSFWDGSWEFYNISETEVQLLSQEKIEPEGVSVASCCVSYNIQAPGVVWLLLTTSNNKLVQYCFDIKSRTKDDSRTSTTQFKGAPLKFTKSVSDSIILFNERQIYALGTDPATNFNKVAPLDYDAQVEFTDICFLKHDVIAAATANNDLVVFSIKSMDSTRDVIFSNDFNLKSVSVPSSHHSLLISSKNAFNESDNSYTRNWFLQLVDTQRMKVVGRYDFSDAGLEVADLVFLEDDADDGGKVFLTVSNTTNSKQVFQLFTIKKNKISPLPSIKVVGLSAGSNVSYKSIVKIKGEHNTFLVNGSVCFVLRINSLEEAEIFKRAFYKTPIFAAVGHTVERKVVVADVMRGISIFDWEKANDGFAFDHTSHRTVLNTNLVTDMCVYEANNKSHMLVVDSLGNISGLDVDTADEVVAYNLGQSINCLHQVQRGETMDFVGRFDAGAESSELISAFFVLGTLNGGIYGLGELADLDDEVSDVLVRCEAELVKYKSTLSDLGSTKKDKLRHWRALHDKKTLRRDDDGRPITVDQRGVISLELFQKWLFRDAVLSSYDQRSAENQHELAAMQAALKYCYLKKPLVQALVAQSTNCIY